MLDPDLRQRHSDAQGKAGFSSSEKAPQQEGMELWAQENGPSGGVLKRNISRNTGCFRREKIWAWLNR